MNWIKKLVGEMKVHNITIQNLADQIGCSRKWVSLVLNGHRTSKDAKEKFTRALNEIIKSKN